MTVEQITQNSMANDKIVDLDKDGTNETTANDAIPIYTEQAAKQLAPAVINYWEGNQIGALAIGKSVCLGYSKAYAYLVQASHPEIYGKNGASTDMSKADNWKEAKELYTFSSDGKKVNTDGNYSVDLVRITFNANVTMYGETQSDFNSDHFWNAVKVDGKWYYVDPCYTDCYSEVMTRDRVETDGYMNHMYFMFSDTTARNLYDGYFKELNTAYQDAATDKTYEDAWFARAKSDVGSDGTNMYYVYDSTNLIKQLNNSKQDQTNSKEDPEYKLVSHPITNKDSGDGDTDYTTLIDFTYKPDSNKDDTVVRVYNPKTKKMETNDMLTELYAKHAEQADIYPSIAITCAQYEGKLYFNLSNYILSYDLTSGEVATVKKYDTVYGKRDKTNAFGGMSFALVNSADGADFTFRDHPIAGISLKSDGKLYVSVATNLAYISGKDVILHIIGMIGVDGALYKSMEFVGEGVASLSMSDRLTMTNMAIEAGAKNGIFAVDDQTLAYVAEHSDRKPVVYTADEDAVYEKKYVIDLSEIKSTVAFPHLPGNTRTIDEVGDVKIDQVVIGSCTNGFYRDMEEAASILKGKKVAKNVRAIIIPATQAIYLKAMENGLLKTFIEAGCVVSTPTCGPCLGGHMGILAAGERAVSTTNRNFVGRMGHPTSEVYLASPAVAAASAITGRITDPKEVLAK